MDTSRFKVGDVFEYDLTIPRHVKLLFPTMSDEDVIAFIKLPKTLLRGRAIVSYVDNVNGIIYFKHK